jgi:hypothetical protein
MLPLLRAGRPVYDGDNLFDRAARATIGRTGNYVQIDELHQRLFSAGMTAPEMSALAGRRYWAAWARFPLAMIEATLQNLRPVYLAMPFEPLETVGDLIVFAGGKRPDFVQLNRQWQHLQAGEPKAALWIGLDFLTRLIGTTIALFGIAGPWLRKGAWQLRALWCVCAGLVAGYLPVHLELRFVSTAGLNAADTGGRKQA